MSALPPSRPPAASRQARPARADAPDEASFIAAHAIALLAVAATVIVLTEALLQFARLLRPA